MLIYLIIGTWASGFLTMMTLSWLFDRRTPSLAIVSFSLALALDVLCYIIARSIQCSM